MNIFYVKNKRNAPELIMTVLTTLLTGVLAFLLAKNYTQSYTSFAEYRAMPPVAIFPLVWFFLLLFMGISSYRVKLIHPSSNGHIFYALQILAGLIWSICFFRFDSLDKSFILSVLFLLSLAATYLEFDKVDRTAGILMIPAVLCAIFTVLINFIMIC